MCVCVYIYIYIYIYIYRTIVTANNYMFRPLTGHYQVVHLMKRGPHPFSLDVQPDDSLLEAETCNC
jgi:hypothetical protein